MPKLKADLLTRPLIKVAVDAVAVAIIDWCSMAGELRVTFASVGCAQFMKALYPVLMQNFTSWEHRPLQERGVGFGPVQ